MAQRTKNIIYLYDALVWDFSVSSDPSSPQRETHQNHCGRTVKTAFSLPSVCIKYQCPKLFFKQWLYSRCGATATCWNRVKLINFGVSGKHKVSPWIPSMKTVDPSVVFHVFLSCNGIGVSPTSSKWKLKVKRITTGALKVWESGFFLAPSLLWHFVLLYKSQLKIKWIFPEKPNQCIYPWFGLYLVYLF